MQYRILAPRARRLARGAAVLVIAGAAAGCSSDVLRFRDGIPTASTQPVPQQQEYAAQQYPQQYPQQTQQQYDPYQSAQAQNLDATYTGSISRQAVQQPALDARQSRRNNATGRIPVPAADVGGMRQPLSQPAPQMAAQPRQPFPSGPSAPAAPSGQVTRQAMAPVTQPGGVDTTVTGSISRPQQQMQEPAPRRAAPSGPAGWSSAGGTTVTVRPGETVSHLSTRYGVPTAEIMKANGLSNPNQVQAGQKVVIPTYGQSRPATANAPADRPQAPSGQGDERLAVLPQGNRLNPGERSGTAAPANNAPSAGSVYTVVSGDTLSAIARRMGTTTTAIKEANSLTDTRIRIGQKLVVPGNGAPAQQMAAAAPPEGVDPMVTGATRGTDSRPATANAPQQPSETTLAAAAEQGGVAPDATGIGKMRWPARGRVISAFGASQGSKSNEGIDIALPEGTPIKAAENGVVIYAGNGLKDFGNTVLVRHENGLVTVYGHASKIQVERGATVRRGQDIALSGLSGNAEAPKLHFEVRKDSVPVDPAKYLE